MTLCISCQKLRVGDMHQVSAIQCQKNAASPGSHAKRCNAYQKDHHCKRSSHPKHFKIFKGQKLQILRILFFVFFNHSLWHVSENRSKNVSAYPHVCPARRSFTFSLQCPMVTVVTVSQGSKALRTRFPCYHWCSCPSSAHWWKWEMPTQRRRSERCSPRHC